MLFNRTKRFQMAIMQDNACTLSDNSGNLIYGMVINNTYHLNAVKPSPNVPVPMSAYVEGQLCKHSKNYSKASYSTLLNGKNHSITQNKKNSTSFYQSRLKKLAKESITKCSAKGFSKLSHAYKIADIKFINVQPLSSIITSSCAKSIAHVNLRPHSLGVEPCTTTFDARHLQSLLSELEHQSVAAAVEIKKIRKKRGTKPDICFFISSLKLMKDVVSRRRSLEELGVNFNSLSCGYELNEKQCINVFNATPTKITVDKKKVTVNKMRQWLGSMVNYFFYGNDESVNPWQKGPPLGWPVGVVYCDPNNAMKDEFGIVGKKPNKKTLFPMYQLLVTKMLAEICANFNYCSNNDSAILTNAQSRCVAVCDENSNSYNDSHETQPVTSDNDLICLEALNAVLRHYRNGGNSSIDDCKDDSNEVKASTGSLVEQFCELTTDNNEFSTISHVPMDFNETRRKVAFQLTNKTSSSVEDILYSQENLDESLIANDTNPPINEEKIMNFDDEFSSMFRQNSVISYNEIGCRNYNLELYLQEKGLKAVDVQGDGNCFFRALSYLIFESEEHHYFIRQKVGQSMENLINSPDNLPPNMHHICVMAEDNRQRYIKSLCILGNYECVGEELMPVVAELFHREVQVYLGRTVQTYRPSSHCDHPPLRVAFYEPKHYKAVITRM